jgi:hypothetical protein
MIPESKEYYSSRRWDVFFGLLAPIEQRILYSIATNTLAANEHINLEFIADACLKNPNEILLPLQELELAGIVVGYNGNGLFKPAYFLNSHPFERYCAAIPVAQIFDPVQIAAELTSEFHRLARRRIERITAVGIEISLDSIGDGLTKIFCLANSKTS